MKRNSPANQDEPARKCRKIPCINEEIRPQKSSAPRLRLLIVIHCKSTPARLRLLINSPRYSKGTHRPTQEDPARRCRKIPCINEEIPSQKSSAHRLRLLIIIHRKSTPARLRLLINPPRSSRNPRAQMKRNFSVNQEESARTSSAPSL